MPNNRLHPTFSRVEPHAWWVFLGVGLAAIVAFYLLPRVPQALLYDVLGVTCGVAILIGITVNRPAHRLPWVLIAAGQFLLSAGDFIWDYWDLVLHRNPFPSGADVLYLAGYPFLAVAMFLFARYRIPGGDRRSLLDAGIVTTGVAVVAWVYLVGPAAQPGRDPLARLVGTAYPLMDLLVLSVLARLLAVPGRRPLSLVLLATGFALMLVADAGFELAAPGNAVTPLDAMWLLAYLCWGVAGLHPSMARLDESTSVREFHLNHVRLALLAGTSLLAPVVLLVQYVSGGSLEVPIVAGGAALGFVLVLMRMGGLVRDLADTLRERKALEVELLHQALHDPLTGLANRGLLADRLEHALARRAETDRLAAVVFMDLDDFKTVNDTFGHPVGDALLAAVAERIRACVRPADTAARMGGDEFALLLEDLTDEIGAVRAAERLLAALEAPFVLGTREVRIGASVGIAFASGGSISREEVLRNADLAMYLAKRRGTGFYEVFEPAMHRALLERVELQVELERAIADGQLVLHYQPIVSLLDGTPTGVEALVRWNHPERGLLAPGVFIPLAEETGLILPVGRWVLENACRTAAEWRRQSAGERLVMHANLSVRQLQEPGFADSVATALATSCLAPDGLVLEITETVLLDESEASRRNLADLRALGVRLAIDDFGTGYASLAYLRRGPVDALKIDRSFVASITDGPEAQALARTIVALGDALHLETIAEGVEREEELEILRALGCHAAQGFLISRPTTRTDAEVILGLRAPEDGAVTQTTDRPARTGDTEPQRDALHGSCALPAGAQ